MTTPEGPHGHQPEQPGDRPAWGQQPAGGWGDPARAGETRAWGAEEAHAADPAAGPTRVEQPEWGQQEWGRQEWTGTQAGAWGSPPQQPGVWGGAPASAWGGAAPAGPTPDVAQWPDGPAGPGHAGPGYPGQDHPGQGHSGQGHPGQGQWGDAPPAGPWPGEQTPAWAQQPAPGGGWAPSGGEWAPPAQAGGWGGQQLAPPPHGQPWPGQGPQGYPPLPPSDGRSGPARTPLVIGAVVVALVAVFALLAFVAPGFLRPTVFDQAALQAGVQRVLAESYQIAGVGEVACGDPAQGPIAVRTGDEFMCIADVDGVPVPVQVRITSGSGDYEVVRPDL